MLANSVSLFHNRITDYPHLLFKHYCYVLSLPEGTLMSTIYFFWTFKRSSLNRIFHFSFYVLFLHIAPCVLCSTSSFVKNSTVDKFYSEREIVHTCITRIYFWQVNRTFDLPIGLWICLHWEKSCKFGPFLFKTNPEILNTNFYFR